MEKQGLLVLLFLLFCNHEVNAGNSNMSGDGSGDSTTLLPSSFTNEFSPTPPPSTLSLPDTSLPTSSPTTLSLPGTSLPAPSPSTLSLPGTSLPTSSPTTLSLPGTSLPAPSPSTLSLPDTSLPAPSPSTLSLSGTSLPAPSPTTLPKTLASPTPRMIGSISRIAMPSSVPEESDPDDDIEETLIIALAAIGGAVGLLLICICCVLIMMCRLRYINREEIRKTMEFVISVEEKNVELKAITFDDQDAPLYDEIPVETFGAFTAKTTGDGDGKEEQEDGDKKLVAEETITLGTFGLSTVVVENPTGEVKGELPEKKDEKSEIAAVADSGKGDRKDGCSEVAGGETNAQETKGQEIQKQDKKAHEVKESETKELGTKGGAIDITQKEPIGTTREGGAEKGDTAHTKPDPEAGKPKESEREVEDTKTQSKAKQEHVAVRDDSKGGGVQGGGESSGTKKDDSGSTSEGKEAQGAVSVADIDAFDEIEKALGLTLEDLQLTHF